MVQGQSVINAIEIIAESGNYCVWNQLTLPPNFSYNS